MSADQIRRSGNRMSGRSKSALGQSLSIPRCPRYVRFAPTSGGKADVPGGPSWANRGHAATYTFRVISQTRPSTRQSKRIFPECPAIIRSIIRPPKPLRVGSCTFGPPVSFQSRCNWPSGSCDHFKFDLAVGRGQGTVLGRIGRQLVQGDSDGLSGVRSQQDRGTIHRARAVGPSAE